MAEASEDGVQATPEPSVLHILVVGFHHQKGSTVEFAHPLLGSFSPLDSQSFTTQLPPEWKELPYLALPDGCHNYEEDSVFFTLPLPSDPKQAVYGVACCRQIESKDLHQISEEVTRSTVQKSVCVLSKVPVFGFIEAKLQLVTHAYFNSKDFSDVSILQEAYTNLNLSVSQQSTLTMTEVGLSQRDQVLCFEHRLLQIFKALLLGKRVVVYGSPVRKLCTSVLAIASLFPLSIESLSQKKPSSKDEYGFPLKVFPEGSSLQPYLALQQMEVLMDQSCRYILVGAVNPLFEKQQKKICDVFVSREDGLVTVHSQELRSVLHLTAADLRFCSLLTETVHKDPTSSTAHHSEWLGSNEWIQAQFKLYLLSLLATTASGDTIAMDVFSPEFMIAWQKSRAYGSWMLGDHGGISKVEPKHICDRELSMSDLKRRLTAYASDYGMSAQSREQVSHAVQETQRMLSRGMGRVTGAASGVWGAASSAVYSWWWQTEKEENSTANDQ